jgi:hypothetical protein
MLKYLAFYSGRQHVIEADSLYAAKLKAVAHFKVPKSKQGLLSVILAEKDGQPVVHTPE